MYRSRASLILVAALLSGCNAAFTTTDAAQASAQPSAVPSTHPAYSSAGADSVDVSNVAVAAPSNAPRAGGQLDAEDLDGLMWVADSHRSSQPAANADAGGGKHTRMRLTAEDLDSLL